MTLSPSSDLDPDRSQPSGPPLVTVASAAFGASIKWLGYGLAVLGGVLGFVVAIWRDTPHPAWQGELAAILTLTIPLAVLSLVLYSPASFTTSRARGGVNGLIVLPFAALLFQNLFHAQIDPYWPALPAGLAILVVLPLAWSIRSAPGVTSPGALLTVLAVCAGLYGYGATAVIDIQFDTSPGVVTPVQVLGKFENHGRRSHSYNLTLPAWGPRAGPNSIEVSGAVYRALNVGDNVCITLHPGAVGLPWFTSATCPAPKPDEPVAGA
jgi:hypothetical protein